MLRTGDHEVRASGRFVRVAPRKIRIAADMVRGKRVPQALELLTFTPNRGAQVLKKLLTSAIASAQELEIGDIDKLVISKVMVDKGPNNRRWRPRAMGRATRINRFTSHVHLFVANAG